MKLLDRPFGALALIELKLFHDERGFFTENFRQCWMADNGLPTSFPQENRSRSRPGVLRGLHYQTDPAQGKLVSVAHGRIWDVAVDIRLGSPTFGQSFTAELSDSNGRILWIPPGFAHGFCVLGEETADVAYKVTGYYNPATEGGILWSDPQLRLSWPVANPTVSAKDLLLPRLEEISPWEI